MKASMQKRSIQKLLIANRGEISMRIARTCRKLGIKTVGIFSKSDEKSLHLEFCDEVYSLDNGSPADSSLANTYLNIPKIISVLKKSKAQAVHPGYGFLSEQAEFAEAVKKAGAYFVGPTPQSIQAMGNKLEAKRWMGKIGVPLLPGSEHGISNYSDAQLVIKKMGFPILLKAAAGGGGKGMRIVRKQSELKSALEAASREAKAYFGDGTVYIEKFLENPHHVEVQVIGDGKGGGGHVFDRECSIQRRHQKLLEESPSPLLTKHARSKEKILDIANRLVEKMKYRSAGTLEFLADDEGGFYFLEMNTRLQVEHPITEWVTGLDLVELQLQTVLGERFKKGQLTSSQNGHAIEVRLYAETPFDYLPAGGTIHHLQFPQGPFVRIDSAIYQGYSVPLDYDPTLLKLSVWGKTRGAAVANLKAALLELRILGVQSNQGLFFAIVREKNFCNGIYGTNYLEKNKERLVKIYNDERNRLLPHLSIAAVEGLRTSSVRKQLSGGLTYTSPWLHTSRLLQLRGE